VAKTSAGGMSSNNSALFSKKFLYSKTSKRPSLSRAEIDPE